MLTKQDLIKISDTLFEIPKKYRKDMQVPARIYATEKMLEDILQDRSLDQSINVATLPGIQRYSLAMPDIHEGYGFPIGGVAAIKWKGGVISPGGVGYDINCGARILISKLSVSEVKPHLEKLADTLFRDVPLGLGRGGKLKLHGETLRQVLDQGLAWAVNRGYASAEDQDRCEERGAMQGADATRVSDRAKQRGEDQVGTLGSGNHFLEVQEVQEVFDQDMADILGVEQGRVTVMIHTGSRGLGHQVATDYIRLLNQKIRDWDYHLPDRELIYAPLDSREGQNYFSAMAAAANFAWVNRQYLTYLVRQIWQRIFGSSDELRLVYDVAHNIAKKEKHEIRGWEVECCVHRKGATRAFGPGRSELPGIYQKTGQPVLIPGSMGTNSFVLLGTEKAVRETFGSSCHGAGRVMSRGEAKRRVRGEKLRQELEQRGILVRAGSMGGLAEEAPLAYKNIESVVDVVSQAGMAKKIVRLMPLCVIKG